MEPTGNVEGERIVLDPKERAIHWAEQGVVFAAQEFGQYAGLEKEDMQALLSKAHEVSAEKLRNLSTTTHPDGRQLFVDDDRDPISMLTETLANNQPNRGADEYLYRTLIVLRSQIQGRSALNENEARAHEDLANYLKQ